MIHLRRQRKSREAIASINELARLVGLSRESLDAICREKADYYKSFQLPKKRGGSRRIDHPVKLLKEAQRTLLKFLYTALRSQAHLHGGIPRRSIVTHAKCHVGKRYVSTFDVDNFFPSVKCHHLEPVFHEAGLSGSAITIAIDITTLEGSLPQGCPTSPHLANQALAIVEHKALKYAKRNGWHYSRFVDDIAISGDEPVACFEGVLSSTLACGEFGLSGTKINHFDSSQRQIVTNLVVNEQLRPTTEFIKEIKSTLRLCHKVGALQVAISEGVSPRTLKGRMNGRIGHVKACDQKLGKELGKLMYGIDWSSVE